MILLNRIFTVLSVIFICSNVSVNAKVYPVEEWAKRDEVRRVSISPGGDMMAMLRIMESKANPILEIYDAADISQRPFRMDADPMEILDYSWVSETKIIFRARQKVRDKIEGWNQGVFKYASTMLIYDEKNKEWSLKKLTMFGEAARIVNVLPKDSDHVLIGSYDLDGRKRNFERFRTFYKFNLNTLRKQQVTLESERRGNINFDGDGNPRFASGYDGTINSSLLFYRTKESTEWDTIWKQSRGDFEDFDIRGWDPLSPKDLIVIAHNGNDTAGLWSFDPEQKEFKELIYHRSDVDIQYTVYHTNYLQFPDLITGVFYYEGRERKIEWFDENERAMYEQLYKIIPDADTVRVSSRSRDGESMVIYNVGPRDPGTYYLLKNGNLKLVGSKRPAISGKYLADVKAISYKSRDGLNINGFITIPNSEPPYPLVVMPHGGPFVGENPSFDDWAQMLANRGYLVLQPQYRGSKYFGLDFYQSAFINGGEGGKKMQDDKDDGALFLVENGLADPDRMLMFGWSYGGYASLIAASRTPQIYQCVIAGGIVPDMQEQVNYYRSRLNSAKDSVGAQEQLAYRDGAISPINETDKVNIPMLVIHGDLDQRTPMRAARRYVKKLEKTDADFKFVELKGADHFGNTWTYDHKFLMFSEMFDFLDNKCFVNSDNLAQR